jgi:hypothetical protein
MSAIAGTSLIPGTATLAMLPPLQPTPHSTPHPTPRRGITGAKVLTKKDLAAHPKLVPLFDSVRAIPGIIDGIHCNCGCTNPPVFYSLLSCFEGLGMARDCVICQGQARLAVRLHKEGKSLVEIRAAVDAKFA